MKAIAFALFLALVASQSAEPWTYCTLPNDPEAACTFDYNPVCGVMTTGNPQTYGNACGACSTLGVIAHKPGECQDMANNCSANPVDCTVIRLIQNPSCAFQNQKPFEDVNWQICCNTYPYQFIIQGPCPSVPVLPPPPPPPFGVNVCNAQDRNIPCTKIGRPVCALKSNQSRVTYGNGCTACSDPSVVSYLNGSCKPGAIYCKPEDKLKSCPNKPLNACGTKADGNQANFLNGCIACANPQITSYVNGICSTGNNPAPVKYTLCSKLQQVSCRRNNNLVCAIRKIGFPATIRDSCRVCRAGSAFVAYSEGACQVKQCPARKNRPDCTTMRFMQIASCAFYRNGTFQNVVNDMCCLGTTYDRVAQGKCPQ